MIKITSEIVTDFRLKFPAFSDAANWPESVLTAALNEGAANTNSSRWGEFELHSTNPQNFRMRGIYYYAAHWASSFYPYGASDPSAINPVRQMNAEAKNWLSTTAYGVQFSMLKRTASMGPICL